MKDERQHGRRPPLAEAAANGAERPSAILLLPRKMEAFIAADQARDLLECDNVHAVEPGRVPWGSLGLLPGPIAKALARVGARTLHPPGAPRVFVVWHPWQYPLAKALLRRYPQAELWFSVWDRYVEAFSERYHDNARKKRRLSRLYEATASDSKLTAAISTRIVELEREAGRDAELVPHGVDSMPAPGPAAPIVAACLGYLTPRVDWPLLRTLGEQMDDLTVLMIGPADKLCERDADYHACRRLQNFVWLGERAGDEVSRLILCADVGLVPLRVEPYNHGSAPHRILKYARLGRWSITADLSGASTFERAVVRARTPEEWMQALRAHAGARLRPDQELRDWAMQQSSRALNRPLWERLEALKLAPEDTPRLPGSPS